MLRSEDDLIEDQAGRTDFSAGAIRPGAARTTRRRAIRACVEYRGYSSSLVIVIALIGSPLPADSKNTVT